LTIVGTDSVIGSKDLPKDAHKAFKGKKSAAKKE
jgi:hypothetical protein